MNNIKIKKNLKVKIKKSLFITNKNCSRQLIYINLISLVKNKIFKIHYKTNLIKKH